MYEKIKGNVCVCVCVYVCVYVYLCVPEKCWRAHLRVCPMPACTHVHAHSHV